MRQLAGAIHGAWTDPQETEKTNTLALKTRGLRGLRESSGWVMGVWGEEVQEPEFYATKDGH
jgi:hypothetical protein